MNGELIRQYQDRIRKDGLSPRVVEAFYKIPRHKFVKKFRSSSFGWITVTDKNLFQLLPQLYSDRPLVIHGELEDFISEGDRFISTISQPSFVLQILEMLKLKLGQKVFELGTGSGWNAALMGELVGPKGKVVSLEIIPELVDSARAAIAEFNLPQVEILKADAGTGYEKYAPYDRAIFTAGADDLNRSFYSQIKDQGLFVFVLNYHGQNDLLLLLRKNKNHFESLRSVDCSFVPLTGRYHVDTSPWFQTQILNPSLWSVKIYPSDVKVKVKSGEILVVRPESQFIWKTSKN